MHCSHRKLTILTESDRCSWVVCNSCGKHGPSKHSITLALLAWIVSTGDQHPRKPTKARVPRSRKVK